MKTLTILSPVAEDLQRVEQRLHQITQVEFPILATILAGLLQSGGKRLRPALVLLAGHFGTYDRSRLIPLAAAVETLHTATLVHDDLIDNSLLRRGNPTMNTRWHGGAVVLVGDYLFAKAAELAAESESTEVAFLFAQTLGVICRGELRQAFSIGNGQPTISEYLERIFSKTASLFASSSKSGAVLAGATPAHCQALHDYGLHFGMAFQIVDDILDFTGTERELGKPVGSDLRQGTITLPTIHYLQANPGDNPVWHYLANSTDGRGRDDALQAAVQCITGSKAIELSFNNAREFVSRAKEAALALPDTEYRQALLELADYVIERRV